MNRPLICLTMIVKNEASNIERCLRSAIGHVDACAIVDTGSTDGTKDKIRAFLEPFPEKALAISDGPFEDFSQARNLSLDLAKTTLITTGSDVHAQRRCADWFLLLDADMTLKCDRDLHDILADEIRKHNDTPNAYHIMQTTPHEAIFPNIRLVRCGSGAHYKGSTHEVIHMDNRFAPLIHGVRIIDHETGSNRVDKIERDARLLENEIKTDPDNMRTIFYLAQTYASRGGDGDTARAAFLYHHRASLGESYDEERWLARLYEARECLKLGRDGEFLFAAFDAWTMRPWRAEPLYELAKYFRRKNMFEPARVMAAKGLELSYPTVETLFVEGSVYSWALREEYVLSASMSENPMYRERGARICNELALDHNVSRETRYAARNNLLAYVAPLSTPCPSFQTSPINFVPPDGFSCGLPSIIAVNDGFLLMQRAVNYEIKILSDGRPRFKTRDGGPIRSRNFFLQLDRYLNILPLSQQEIADPAGLMYSSRIQGIEDVRFAGVIGNAIYVTGMSMAPEPNELCREIFGRLDLNASRIVDWRILPSPNNTDEKNWLSFVKNGKIGWIYRCADSVVLDDQANILKMSKPPFCAEVMCGGSQLIDFDGGYLGIVHEHTTNPENKSRAYLHRFVWFNNDLELTKCSPPFIIEKKGIEYISGLTSKDNGRTLVLSYHIDDLTSWLATVSAADVRKMVG